MTLAYLQTLFPNGICLFDSDNDGLSDYEEMLLTSSGPTVYNSINEYLSDKGADSDGLSNITEIELGTNLLTPDSYGEEVDVNTEVMIGRVDFSGYKDLYDKFKEKTQDNNDIRDYVIFNENSYIAWLCWYNKEVM